MPPQFSKHPSLNDHPKRHPTTEAVCCSPEPSNNEACAAPMPTDDTGTERSAQIDALKIFLATAPDSGGWQVVEPHSSIKRFRLPVVDEDISCVMWDNLFFMSGTDIVRSLTFRFHAFGRPVTNAKKFEEGIFSDLRNLKPGMDARLEEPKSDLLDLLYRHNCIRTQKKQKVFFWFSVPHDRLFLDALQRDLKREKLDMEPATTAVAAPATSISLDSSMELFDKLRKDMAQAAAADDATGPNGDDNDRPSSDVVRQRHRSTGVSSVAAAAAAPRAGSSSGSGRVTKPAAARRMTDADLSKKRVLFGALELFDGSPTYKQRRRRRHRSASATTAFHAPPATPQHWRSATAPCDWMMEPALPPPRAYTCTHCGHPFQQLEMLDAHLRSHEREQPFVCGLCGKRFVCQLGLSEHQHVFHPFDASGRCCCCCCSWSPAAPIPAATPILDEDASSLVASPCTPASLFAPYIDPCWTTAAAAVAAGAAPQPNKGQSTMWLATPDDWMLPHQHDGDDHPHHSYSSSSSMTLPPNVHPQAQTVATSLSIPLL